MAARLFDCLRIRPATVAGIALLAALLGALPAAAHRTVERTPEVWTADERLLVVDSATGTIVVLDDGQEVERLSSPRTPISLARSGDGTLAFVLRGRDTDRDHVTVIDTAFDEATGEARRPFVARAFLAGAPGGVSRGRLPEAADGIVIAEEAAGELVLLDPGQLVGLGAAEVRRLTVLQPDHYAIVVGQVGAEAVLHVGHLRAGTVQVLDPVSGAELARHPGCPGLHGGAVDGTGTRALFGCGNGVLVVPMNPGTGAEASLIPYPGDGRIAAFHQGASGVLWGTTEGAQSAVHRVDTAGETPVIEQLDLGRRGVKRTALRVSTTPGGGRLLILTHQGFLQIRDGSDGTLVREVQLGERYDLDFHEHVGGAEAPDLAAAPGHVHVSQPTGGRIVTVDLVSGQVTNRIKVGGMPTRMVLLARGTAPP